MAHDRGGPAKKAYIKRNASGKATTLEELELRRETGKATTLEEVELRRETAWSTAAYHPWRLGPEVGSLRHTRIQRKIGAVEPEESLASLDPRQKTQARE